MFTKSSSSRCVGAVQRCPSVSSAVLTLLTASCVSLRRPCVKERSWAALSSPPLCLSLTSLIDRRGFVQSDTPQLAPPTNGITMYGATQSQQSHMVRPPHTHTHTYISCLFMFRPVDYLAFKPCCHDLLLLHHCRAAAQSTRTSFLTGFSLEIIWRNCGKALMSSASV